MICYILETKNKNKCDLAYKSLALLLQLMEFVFVIHICILFNPVFKLYVLVNDKLTFYLCVGFVANYLNYHVFCTLLQNILTYLQIHELLRKINNKII